MKKTIVISLLIIGIGLSSVLILENRKNNENIEYYPDTYTIVRTNRIYENSDGSQLGTFKIENDAVVQIKTVQQLNEYIKEASLYYSCENSLKPAVEKYDNKYFKDRNLLIIPITSSSGSVRYQFYQITIDGTEATVEINCLYPEVGTCDMAYWFMLIEIDSRKYSNVTSFNVHNNIIGSYIIDEKKLD